MSHTDFTVSTCLTFVGYVTEVPAYAEESIQRLCTEACRILGTRDLTMKLCPECNKLEAKYQSALAEIYSVVDGRFNTVGDKLRALFRWQDARDRAVKAIYEHKKTHAMVPSSVPRKTAEPSRQPEPDSLPMRSST